MHSVSRVSVGDIGDRSLEDVIRDLQDGRNANDNFRWIFERYHRLIFRSFERSGISPEDSRDLVQEVFLAAFRSIHDLRNASGFSAWLLSIGRNALRNEIERQRSQKRFGYHVCVEQSAEPEAAAGLAELADHNPASDVLGMILDQEKLAKVTEALGNLPAQMRRCAHLRIVEDRSYSEIAEIIGISINTVKAHLHQAKKAMKDKLSLYYFGAGMLGLTNGHIHRN